MGDLELSFAPFCVAAGGSGPIGILAAVKPHSLQDHAVMTLTLIGQSAPTFWIGIMPDLTFGWSCAGFPSVGVGRYRICHARSHAGRLRHGQHRTVDTVCDARCGSASTTSTPRAPKGSAIAESSGKHALKNAAIPW